MEEDRPATGLEVLLFARVNTPQSESTRTFAPPSKRIVRGLEWIWAQARADFEAASGERGTGAFAGTTEKEVDEALDWLNNLTRKP
jgi:hypothetical protein